MKNLSIIYIILVFAFLVSCATVTEPDMKGKLVNLKAPADGTVTSNRTQIFWWDEVEYAEKYNLQIVSPSFASPVSLVLDTNLTKNQYEVTLSPGEYEWRVAAYSGTSRSESMIEFSFEILALDGISYQNVEITLPGMAAPYFNAQEVTFEWEAVKYAKYYSIDVRKNNWNGESVLDSDPEDRITETTYTTTLNEGEYMLGVVAYDSVGDQTDWSTRQFTVDFTPPQTPTITTPDSNIDTLNKSPYRIEWQQPVTTGSPESNILIVASDSLFESILYDSITIVNDKYYSCSAWNNGRYWIRILTVDAAGNASGNADRGFYLFKEDNE